MKLIIVCTSIFSIILGASIEDDRWRIVGGRDALEGEVPQIVSLQLNNIHNCGGVLVHEKWALTAAHCVFGRNPATLTIVVGSNTLNPAGVRYDVDHYTIYDSYVINSLFDDIAILHIATGVTLEAGRIETAPICRHQIQDINCTLAGWGSTFLGGPTPNNLQFIKLKSLTDEECETKWPGLVAQCNVCTLTVVGEGACHGDSGSPVMSDEDPKCVMGLVNWGNPCANGRPDVHVRVSCYQNWISNNTNGDV